MNLANEKLKQYVKRRLLIMLRIIWALFMLYPLLLAINNATQEGKWFSGIGIAVFIIIGAIYIPRLFIIAFQRFAKELTKKA